MKPTCQCGKLGLSNLEEEVIVAGWVQRRRDHGGLIFLDIRDSSGLVQVVFSPDTRPDAHSLAHDVRSEFVLAVRGKVSKRPVGTENMNLSTGEIEVWPMNWRY